MMQRSSSWEGETSIRCFSKLYDPNSYRRDEFVPYNLRKRVIAYIEIQLEKKILHRTLFDLHCFQYMTPFIRNFSIYSTVSVCCYGNKECCFLKWRYWFEVVVYIGQDWAVVVVV